MPNYKLLLPLCLVFSLFIVSSSRAQKKEIPAYIVNLAGDTIHGSVAYTNWRKNPDQISFRNTDNILKTYKPSDIISFAANDDIYISAIIDMERSSLVESELEYDPSYRLIKGNNSFLKTIIDGPKSLYYLKDTFGKNQLYIRTNSGFELLKFKKYLKQVQGKTLIKENTSFRDQIRNYLSDCPEVLSKHSTVRYNLEDLKKIFIEYYSCINKVISFQVQEKRAPVHFGLIAGISNTQLTFKGDEYIYLSEGDANSSTDFAAGVFLNIVFAGSNEKWSLYNEVHYNSFLINIDYSDIRSTEIFDNYYAEIGYKQIKLNNMLQYKFPIAGFHSFIKAGVHNAFALGKTDHLRIESQVFSNVSLSETTVGRGDDLRNYEVGLSVGFGVKIQKYILELRYSGGNGVSDFAASNTSQLFILLGYEF